jgi:hypothetical protein
MDQDPMAEPIVECQAAISKMLPQGLDADWKVAADMALVLFPTHSVLKEALEKGGALHDAFITIPYLGNEAYAALTGPVPSSEEGKKVRKAAQDKLYAQRQEFLNKWVHPGKEFFGRDKALYQRTKGGVPERKFTPSTLPTALNAVLSEGLLSPAQLLEKHDAIWGSDSPVRGVFMASTLKGKSRYVEALMKQFITLRGVAPPNVILMLGSAGANKSYRWLEDNGVEQQMPDADTLAEFVEQRRLMATEADKASVPRLPSIIILDDLMGLPTKEKKALLDVADKVFTAGRHLNITIVVQSQKPNDVITQNMQNSSSLYVFGEFDTPCSINYIGHHAAGTGGAGRGNISTAAWADFYKTYIGANSNLVFGAKIGSKKASAAHFVLTAAPCCNTFAACVAGEACPSYGTEFFNKKPFIPSTAEETVSIAPPLGSGKRSRGELVPADVVVPAEPAQSYDWAKLAQQFNASCPSGASVWLARRDAIGQGLPLIAALKASGTNLNLSVPRPTTPHFCLAVLPIDVSEDLAASVINEVVSKPFPFAMMMPSNALHFSKVRDFFDVSTYSVFLQCHGEAPSKAACLWWTPGTAGICHHVPKTPPPAAAVGGGGGGDAAYINGGLAGGIGALGLDDDEPF